MRITVHLDTFDRVHPCAYAILWLDDKTHKWSREGHFGLELPEWGTWSTDSGNTLIRAPHDMRSLCMLDGLDMRGASGPFEGETGAAHWRGDEGLLRAEGHWHVQCIDHDPADAEHSVFADDDLG
ncbi:DUF3564 family protein [Paraburkholderia sp. BL10I2N1]|uniref:DUF3564 family protein n=1 Tax=Paraburkholderia sp. BL10I2N1 TaxID=1938796 RepID=UPI00105D2BE8|nr:DUF3564 family protein [Paraburkholderia sp. BL10I2N1]TDN63209.1 uncharacterized protein DUF3564 [Paraburkholderia sp. BL10I2N1]